MTGSLAPAQIARQIESIRKKRAKDRIIGFYSPAAWSGGSSLEIDGERVEIAPCRSELEIRERLSGRDPEAPPLVILTALSETDLGEDVLARLARRKLFRVDRWDTLREWFGVRELDARLAGSPWLVDAALAVAGDAAPAPIPGGVLSADYLWELLLAGALGLPSGKPDLLTLLEWSLTTDVERYRELRDEVKSGIRERLSTTAGAAGALLLDAVAAGHGRDAVALGLVCDVVANERGASAGAVALAEARVRLERFVADRKISEEAARAWARGALELVRRRAGDRRLEELSPQLQRADEILKDQSVDSYAWLSSILPSGLDERLARLGAAVESFLADRSALDEVCESARLVRSHQLVDTGGGRGVAVEMVERLCRYLTTPVAEKRSFAEAALSYAREGELVDRALNVLIGGDPQPRFSAATERLRAAVVDRCESDAKAFAELLRGWTEADGSRDAVLPIEDVLDRVVAPLAERVPVLMIVLDGMSGAVFEEIASDVTLPGRWLALRPADAVPDSALAPSAPPVIAALPTLTEVSRASLLCGKLTDGAQANEKKGFAAHAALARIAGQKFPPRLFHKGELTGRQETDLSDDVRSAVAGSDYKVVGVVLNAVDDFLAKSDQLRHPWRLESVHLLKALFDTAYDAGRAVVVTSDHGHVLDTGSERTTKADSDRFRLNDPPAGEGEVMLAGRRVAASVGARIVAAWSRKLRYASKKNGYHGGASPQEVIVPLGVFAPLGLPVEGWRETGLFRPDWWLGGGVEAPVPAKPASHKPKPTKAKVAQGQQDLFVPLDEVADGKAVYRGPEWIEKLFASEVYSQQLESAGRVAPSEEQIRQVLASLSERGGKLTRKALAQKLGLQVSRVQGIVTGLRQVLNVDGYNVLEIDDASDSLAVNVEVLRVQFGIDDG